jgi:hypothetical protein
MCGYSRSEKQYRDRNQGFCTGIAYPKMEHYSNEDAATTQGNRFRRCLKPVIGIGQPYDPNAPQQVKKYSDCYEYQGYHITH